jgi:GNAT superfamily N-acetyltransferase
VRAMIVRPMRPPDVDAAFQVSVAAFDDLARRTGQPEDTPASVAFGRLRVGRPLRTDPGGSWVAEDDGRIVGVATAVVREGVWGLSLLVVRPEAQSAGAGRELLARAFAYGEGVRGRIILASSDTRALRSYARLGLDLHPAITARGRACAEPVAVVRPGTGEDLPLTEAVDRAVRGAAHGEDILALVESGGRLLVLPERGYAVVRGGAVRLLAAFDDESAATLLRGCFAATDGEEESSVRWITSAQQWAIVPCVEAGLELVGEGGAVFLGGDVGPFAPYLPSGAYL